MFHWASCLHDIFCFYYTKGPKMQWLIVYIVYNYCVERKMLTKFFNPSFYWWLSLPLQDLAGFLLKRYILEICASLSPPSPCKLGIDRFFQCLSLKVHVPTKCCTMCMKGKNPVLHLRTHLLDNIWPS